jgi:hypothetical protein
MVVRSKDLVLREFGVFLWKLISRRPQAKHGEGSHSVLFLESIVHFLFTQLVVQLLIQGPFFMQGITYRLVITTKNNKRRT